MKAISFATGFVVAAVGCGVFYAAADDYWIATQGSVPNVTTECPTDKMVVLRGTRVFCESRDAVPLSPDGKPCFAADGCMGNPRLTGEITAGQPLRLGVPDAHGNTITLSKEYEERMRICARGAAAAGRPPADEWKRMKNAALDRAGIPRKRSREYQYNHIIPRCLDGSNDTSNLELQLKAEAKISDQFERHMCKLYCARGSTLSLEDARAAFVK